jgi:endonuclease/exonuclease/phosphatase family metal-dependent hydrolase
VQQDSDVQVPMLAGFDAAGAPLLDGVQMIDRDVVLVRSDVQASRPRSARYAVALPVTMDGVTTEIVRGWASVVIQTEAGPFRFITTHLEDHVAEIQAAQAEELLGITAAERLPIVLAGDFNSPADGSETPTYGVIAASGFHDAWAAAHPGDPGFTCCRAADLHAAAPLTQRLDIVFARGRASHAMPSAVSAVIVGDAPRDRTRSGLWPSDHAGVVATFPAPTSW